MSAFRPRILSDDAASYPRDAEIETLIARATSGLAVLAEPGAGTSELLRGAFDKLFFEQSQFAPFYFEIRRSDADAASAARRFVVEFLRHTIAYWRAEREIVDAALDLDELGRLAAISEVAGVERLIEAALSIRTPIETLLAAPISLALDGRPSFVIIDEIDRAADLEDGELFLIELFRMLGRGRLPFIVAGKRRFLYSRTPFVGMRLDRKSFEETGRIIDAASKERELRVSDSARDLITLLFDRDLRLIRLFLDSAVDRGLDLERLDAAAALYADEILGGLVARRFDRWLDDTIPYSWRLALFDLLVAENPERTESWHESIALEPTEFNRFLERAHQAEFVNSTTFHVSPNRQAHALVDFAKSRLAMASGNLERAALVGQMITECVRRTRPMMEARYRRAAATGLREIIDRFAGQKVPKTMLDYALFRDLKGLAAEKLEEKLALRSGEIMLPNILMTADAESYYPLLAKICDANRSCVAEGFTDRSNRTAVQWIAVEIDSKLEATADTAEFWCDRLEMIAASCEFSNPKFWLVAREGFEEEALELLASRGAIASSRTQAELLSRKLDLPTVEKDGERYELTLPMNEDFELLATGIVDEIARRHSVDAKIAGQIRTALVEASINASEHSLSPDRQLHLYINISETLFTVKVASRGIGLSPAVLEETVESERRGWGLQLIRQLMDEVEIEAVEDGTSIKISKSLSKEDLATNARIRNL